MGVKGVMSGFDIAASGLAAERTRMGVIGENIAMAGATRTSTGGPYVRRTVVFEEMLDEAGGAAGVSVARIQKDTTNPHVRVLDPGHQDADSDGYVTYPNVNIVAEMVDFNISRRSYEANLAVFRAYRNMVRNAVANLTR